MTITIKNHLNKSVDIDINTKTPVIELTAQLSNIFDEFPVDTVIDEGQKILAKVNKALLNNAIDEVIFTDNIFKTMYNKITYGKYTIKYNEDKTGYLLSSVNIVSKAIPTDKKNEDGKTIKENRPDFIDYVKVCKRYSQLKSEYKKQDLKLDALKGDFKPLEKMLISVFINNVLDRPLTDLQVAKLNAKGDEFKRFTEKSNNAKLDQLNYIYDIFNKHTGNNTKAINKVIGNIYDEMKNFSSKYMLSTVENETTVISIIFNHYVNSSMITYEKYKAQKIDNLIKEPKAKKTKKEEPKKA